MTTQPDDLSKSDPNNEINSQNVDVYAASGNTVTADHADAGKPKGGEPAAADSFKRRRPVLRRFSLRRFLLLSGILIVVAVPCFIEFFLRRPVGEGPAGPAVSLAAFQEQWTDQKVLVLGLGDSVTRGLGAKSPARSYFNRVVQNPKNDFADIDGACLSTVIPSLANVNLAVSGSTSLDHEEVIKNGLPDVDESTFGLVMMTTGGNDLIHSYGRMPPREGAMYGATLEEAKPWIASFSRRLDQMIVSITSHFPGGCEIYLGDIYDPTDGVGDAASIFLPPWDDGLAIHARYNQAINEIADLHSNVHVVPMHKTFLGHGSHCRQIWRSSYDAGDPHYWFYTNIEDPNDRGYDAIRRLFLNAIVSNSSLNCLR